MYKILANKLIMYKKIKRIVNFLVFCNKQKDSISKFFYNLFEAKKTYKSKKKFKENLLMIYKILYSK